MGRIVIREGLETPEQRAWWFANLNSEGADLSEASGEEISAKFKGSIKDITPEEKTAISLYSEHSFNINKQLRAGQEPRGDLYGPAYQPSGKDAAKTAAGVESAISKSELPENLTLYRGINRIEAGGEADRIVQGLKDGTIEKGSTIDDKAFMSTSLRKEKVTSNFTAPGSIMLKIDAPKGTNGLHISTATGKYDNNQEVILPKNTRLRIDSFHEETIITKYNPPKRVMVVNVSVVKKNTIKEFVIKEGLETPEQRAWSLL